MQIQVVQFLIVSAFLLIWLRCFCRGIRASKTPSEGRPDPWAYIGDRELEKSRLRASRGRGTRAFPPVPSRAMQPE
jgi:hypothetical protein